MSNRVAALLRLFVDTYRKYGLERFLIYVFVNRRWPKWLFFYTRHTLLACKEVKLSDSMRRRVSRSNVQIDVAVQEDYALIAQFWCQQGDCDWPVKQKGLEKEHESGMRIFIARGEEKVHGFIQIFKYSRKIPFLHGKSATYISSSDGIGLFGYGLIAPEWRMKGLFLQLMSAIFQQNPNKDFFVTDISPLNLHSINSHRRIGFEEFIQIRYFLMFNVFPVWHVRTRSDSKWSVRRNLDLSQDMLEEAYSQLKQA